MAISIDKGPLQIKYPMIYMQGREGLLQTRAPASKGLYMIYRKGPHTGMQGAPEDKSPCGQRAPTENGHIRQSNSTDEVSLHTRGLTDKGGSQTRSSYRQMAFTAEDPYRRSVIPTDKGLSQTIMGPYRQLGALADN